MKIIILLLAYSILINSSVAAQQSAYNAADILATKAIERVKAGDTKLADSLIKKSIVTYPVYGVINYAKELMLLPDVAGANIIMRLLKEKVAAIDGKILIPDPIQLMGNPKIMLKEYEKDRAYFNYLFWIYSLNRTYANRDYILESMRDLNTINIIQRRNKSGKLDYDFEHNIQSAYQIIEATYKGEFEKARTLINAIPVTLYTPKEVILTYHISVDIGAKDYEKGLERINILAKSNNYKESANNWFFNLYTAMGDEKALNYYPNITPSLKEHNRTYYQLSLIDLAKKDYSSALKNLEKSAALRNKQNIMADMIIEGWDFYKTYGDVYTGLKQYEKARDNYNISLIYYPSYKNTINAIAKMEALASNDIAIDKIAPEIVVTEPSPNRGLKVVSALSNVLVKGFAKDISGIKEVTINGLKVYAQPNGDFWGDVPMKNGINKILVTAIDNAGNKAEKSFEIEKTEPTAISNATSIVAVTEKVGKNYCLLIAAQNYQDTAIPSLNNPVADAIKLKIILKRDYGFEQEQIISLFNPSTNDINRQLLELTNTIQPEDKLVIFYAGHGIWVEKEKKGYWLMTDANYKDPSTWLPNKEVLDLVAKLPARHTLLITDACFSGSVFKTRGIPASAPNVIKELDTKISRVAITSGNDTEVPDESVFMKYLVKALNENKEKYLTAQKMFINQIMEAVMTETKTEPRYGTLELAGHVGGDFIFTRK